MTDWNEAHVNGLNAREAADAAWRRQQQKEPNRHGGDGIDTAQYPRPPAFSDEALALRFAERNASRLRFVAKWSSWLKWSGSKWAIEDTLLAFDLARQLCREVASECNKLKIAAAIASAKTVAAVERLARSDRRFAATVDQWDLDYWLLNTPAGMIDLRTGTRLPHRADAYVSKITAVAPDDSCPTPIWNRFLDQVMGGDVELVNFLRRVCGYALTGSTAAHALFFLHGGGANGKTTFLKALTGCLGDYHRTAPIETFIETKSERHPTDLAGLMGARLVTAVETEEGRRWAESKIKTLTGGETVTARFMRQDYFEFTPQFKLVIAGNHKPGLRSVDEAIRRRVNLIPCAVTIPAPERNERLSEELRAEWPGILAWMIGGCLDFRAGGLAPPDAVVSATTEYLDAEDNIVAWVEEACDRDLNRWESSTALFASWKQWADRTGEHAGTMKRFSLRLEEKSESIGLQKRRDPQGRRGFFGLRVRL